MAVNFNTRAGYLKQLQLLEEIYGTPGVKRLGVMEDNTELAATYRFLCGRDDFTYREKYVSGVDKRYWLQAVAPLMINFLEIGQQEYPDLLQEHYIVVVKLSSITQAAGGDILVRYNTVVGKITEIWKTTIADQSEQMRASAARIAALEAKNAELAKQVHQARKKVVLVDVPPDGSRFDVARALAEIIPDLTILTAGDSIKTQKAVVRQTPRYNDRPIREETLDLSRYPHEVVKAALTVIIGHGLGGGFDLVNQIYLYQLASYLQHKKLIELTANDLMEAIKSENLEEFVRSLDQVKILLEPNSEINPQFRKLVLEFLALHFQEIVANECVDKDLQRSLMDLASDREKKDQYGIDFSKSLALEIGQHLFFDLIAQPLHVNREGVVLEICYAWAERVSKMQSGTPNPLEILSMSQKGYRVLLSSIYFEKLSPSEQIIFRRTCSLANYAFDEHQTVQREYLTGLRIEESADVAAAAPPVAVERRESVVVRDSGATTPLSLTNESGGPTAAADPQQVPGAGVGVAVAVELASDADSERSKGSYLVLSGKSASDAASAKTV